MAAEQQLKHFNTMSAVKVLLAGDCLGGFNTLFKRVATVNNKSGPFDLLLCVGQFFEEGGKEQLVK